MAKFLVVGGPTASGKTDAALTIAKHYNGELINADSRQVYKYLNTGTNKGSIKENTLEGVPLHLVDIIDPDVRFTLFDFKKLAEEKIQQIYAKGKLPIVVGGTGLYIDALIKNYNLPKEKDVRPIRQNLIKLSTAELQDHLRKLDPRKFKSLNQSDVNNPRRLIRHIEKVGEVNEQIAFKKQADYVFIYPIYKWEELKSKIEQRVDVMFTQNEPNIIDETKHVLQLGYPETSVALQGIGYKEVLAYLHEEMTFEECVDQVKIAHKQYARRQRTWFEGKGRGYALSKMSFRDLELKRLAKLLAL